MVARLHTSLSTMAMIGSLAVAMAAGGRDASSQEPTFRAEASGVSLDVAVTRGGRPVRGLTAADFVLTDSGVTQRVDSASLETLPLSVFLVLDASGSVAGEKLNYLVEAIRSAMTSLRPEDRVSLITFSERVAVRVPLTRDRMSVTRALSDVKAEGSTALRDATFAALQLLPVDKTRPIVLVFSDGRDTGSWLTGADVLGSVRRTGVVIHAVELVEEESRRTLQGPLGGGPRPQPSSRFLGELVVASGGRRWAATDPVRLAMLFADALNEMRSRYLLTYYPTSIDPGWHPVTVRLARGRADLTHRPGYQVPAR